VGIAALPSAILGLNWGFYQVLIDLANLIGVAIFAAIDVLLSLGIILGIGIGANLAIASSQLLND
ncbi:unnamed protein product, partial [Allacma fusca]